MKSPTLDVWFSRFLRDCVQIYVEAQLVQIDRALRIMAMEAIP